MQTERAISLIETLLMITGECQLEDTLGRTLIECVDEELCVLKAHLLSNRAIPNQTFETTLNTLSSLTTQLESERFEGKDEIVSDLNQICELLA